MILYTHKCSFPNVNSTHRGEGGFLRHTDQSVLGHERQLALLTEAVLGCHSTDKRDWELVRCSCLAFRRLGASGKVNVAREGERKKSSDQYSLFVPTPKKGLTLHQRCSADKVTGVQSHSDTAKRCYAATGVPTTQRIRRAGSRQRIRPCPRCSASPPPRNGTAPRPSRPCTTVLYWTTGRVRSSALHPLSPASATCLVGVLCTFLFISRPRHRS